MSKKNIIDQLKLHGFVESLLSSSSSNSEELNHNSDKNSQQDYAIEIEKPRRDTTAITINQINFNHDEQVILLSPLQPIPSSSLKKVQNGFKNMESRYNNNKRFVVNGNSKTNIEPDISVKNNHFTINDQLTPHSEKKSEKFNDLFNLSGITPFDSSAQTNRNKFNDISEIELTKKDRNSRQKSEIRSSIQNHINNTTSNAKKFDVSDQNKYNSINQLVDIEIDAESLQIFAEKFEENLNKNEKGKEDSIDPDILEKILKENETSLQINEQPVQLNNLDQPHHDYDAFFQENSENEFIGFKTCQGNKLDIPLDKLKNAEKLFEEQPNLDINYSNENIKTVSIDDTLENVIAAFKQKKQQSSVLLSNKLHLTQESLNKAHILFSDMKNVNELKQDKKLVENLNHSTKIPNEKDIICGLNKSKENSPKSIDETKSYSKGKVMIHYGDNSINNMGNPQNMFNFVKTTKNVLPRNMMNNSSLSKNQISEIMPESKSKINIPNTDLSKKSVKIGEIKKSTEKADNPINSKSKLTITHENLSKAFNLFNDSSSFFPNSTKSNPPFDVSSNGSKINGNKSGNNENPRFTPLAANINSLDISRNDELNNKIDPSNQFNDIGNDSFKNQIPNEVTLTTGRNKKIEINKSNLDRALKIFADDQLQENKPKNLLNPKPIIELDNKQVTKKLFTPEDHTKIQNAPKISNAYKPNASKNAADLHINGNNHESKVPLVSSANSKPISKNGNQSIKRTFEQFENTQNEIALDEEKLIDAMLKEAAANTASNQQNNDVKSFTSLKKDFSQNKKIMAYLHKNDGVKSKKKGESTALYSNMALRKDYSQVPKDILCLNLHNAINYTMACSCAEYAMQIEIPNEPKSESNLSFPCFCKGTLVIGWREIREMLLSEGLNKDHIQEKWMKHHYRMIVWKLASYERMFDTLPITKQLCVPNIKDEIEYRYFIEYEEGKRGILQKVIEKDDLMSKHMILMIGDIKYNLKANSYIIELTDGWNSIYTEIKETTSQAQNKSSLSISPFIDLIQKHKIYTGLKIHVYGMHIKKDNKKTGNTNKGEKLPENQNGPVFAELHYNSISRAKWNEKLGIGKSKYLIKSLKSLHPNGGLISMIDVFVIKKYQLIDRQPHGSKIFEMNSNNTVHNGSKIIFKILVIDALIYHDKNRPRNQEPLCEIEFENNLALSIYENIKEGERLRIYNLKPLISSSLSTSTANKHNKNEYFDYQSLILYPKILYLKSNNNTIIQYVNEIKQLKHDINNIKQYIKQNLMIHPNSLSKLYIDYQFYIQNIQYIINEINVIGLILESCTFSNSQYKIYGILTSNQFFVIEILPLKTGYPLTKRHRNIIHSKYFFPNSKTIEKSGNIIVFKNLQLINYEKINTQQGKHLIFILKSTENSHIMTNSTNYKDEMQGLTMLNKDKPLFETKRNIVLKYIKSGSNTNIEEELFDEDALIEKILQEQENSSILTKDIKNNQENHVLNV